MAHNPVIKTQKIGRTNILFTIPPNNAGVLYQGNRFVEILGPGQRPKLTDRVSIDDLIVYLVDTAPHLLIWRPALPARGKQDIFRTTIKLTYRVVDARKMVEDRVSDTESLVSLALEPLLRKVARQYALNHHEEADTDLTNALALETANSALEACGLKRISPPDVVINLTEQDHQRIRTLNELERAMRVARPIHRDDALSSRDITSKFQAAIDLHYKVVNADALPFESLSECETSLWPEVLKVLRQSSRQYSLTQIAEAEAALQATLNETPINIAGLKVESTSIRLDLDETGRQRYTRLAEEEYEALLTQTKVKGMQQNQDLVMVTY